MMKNMTIYLSSINVRKYGTIKYLLMVLIFAVATASADAQTARQQKAYSILTKLNKSIPLKGGNTSFDLQASCSEDLGNGQFNVWFGFTHPSGVSAINTNPYSLLFNGNSFVVVQLNTLSYTTIDSLFSYQFSAGDTLEWFVLAPNGTQLSVIVTHNSNPCAGFQSNILPYYPPPPNGKVNDLIGSELSSLASNFGSGADSLDEIYLIKDDSVWIEIIAIQGQYQNLLNLVLTLPYGLNHLIDNGPNTLIITGLFPIANLSKLDSLPLLINYCRPVYPPINNFGVADNAGDFSMHTDLARLGFEVDGNGVKVGVLSNSYNTILGNPAHTDVVNGDLPGTGNPDYPSPVHVLKDYPYGVQSDEGRAMLQIVHDVAPGAELAFRTGFISAGDFAQGIKELQADSCDIIVDDITFITEPYFADGIISQAVDTVASQGVSYFTSAGNYGSKAYQSIFNPIPAPAGITGDVHDYGSGDYLQSVTLPPGTYTIVLQWQDSIYSLGQTQTGTNNDLDIYLTDNSGSALFGFNRNNLGGDPLEVMPFTVTDSAANTNFMVVRAAGSDNVIFKYIVFRGDITFNEYLDGTSTIVGQANAKGSMAVGAVLYDRSPAYPGTTTTIASFSSRGGTPINGVYRQKPDFAAPNGVNTTVELGGYNYDGDPFPNFFGTSASAPQAAGAAALMIEARNKFYGEYLGPDSVRALLRRSAHDMHAPGFDYESGYGFIQPVAAMSEFASPKPEILALLLPDTTTTPGDSAFTVVVEGNNLTGESVILFRGDSIPTTFVNSSTLTAVIPAFSGNPAIQVYTPSSTPSGLDGGQSDTLYFFSAIKSTIIITADDKTKRYGEVLPLFTVSITIDSIPLDSTGLTLADIGLDTVNIQTPANDLSNVGIYFIRPTMNPLDPNDSVDVALLETYNYIFNDGLLFIEELPLIIRAKDTTITYGDNIGGFGFDYVYDDSLIDAGQKALLNGLILNDHVGNMSDATALIDARRTAGARALVNADLEQLSFLVSARSSARARALVNARARARALVNGSPMPDTMRIIDLSLRSLFEYQVDSANGILDTTTSLANAASRARARALVNSLALANGDATVNARQSASARALVNGDVAVNARRSASARALVNSEIAVIIDEEDYTAPPNDTLYGFKPITLITGITAGLHSIVPGALLSNNFIISYELGNLTILPAPLTIEADTSTVTYGDSLLVSYAYSGFEFEDSIESVILSPPGYSLVDIGTGTVVSDTTPPAGIFHVVPDSVQLDTASNYVVVYSHGLLTVDKATLSVSANDTNFVYGETPVASFTISGLKYADTEGSAISVMPGTEFLDTANIPVGATGIDAGTYTIVPGGLGFSGSSNYVVNYVNATLIVSPAALTVTADLKYMNQEGTPPTYTSSISGFLFNDAASILSGPTYTMTGNTTEAGIYDIVPGNLVLSEPWNYTIDYVPGDLYVNPFGSGTAKIDIYDVCVEYEPGHISGFDFVARFKYRNTNSSAVYIPSGSSNRIYSFGAYSGSPPNVFDPGEGVYELHFDGSYILWIVISNYNSSTGFSIRLASRASPSCLKLLAEEDEIIDQEFNVRIFPNPFRDRVRIETPGKNISEQDVSVIDMQGKICRIHSVSRISDQSVEIDLSGLSEGLYFVRVPSKDGYTMHKVIKQ